MNAYEPVEFTIQTNIFLFGMIVVFIAFCLFGLFCYRLGMTVAEMRAEDAAKEAAKKRHPATRSKVERERVSSTVRVVRSSGNKVGFRLLNGGYRDDAS